MEAKDIIPNLEKPVIYNGESYILKAGIIRRNRNGGLFYQAEILDKNGRTVYIVSLKDITDGAHT